MDKTSAPIRFRLELAGMVAIAIALNLAGAVISKWIAMSLPHAISLICLLCVIYFLRTLYWVFAGRHWQLSFLYPVLSISYLASFALGVLMFDEAFSWQRLSGSLIILAGVWLISTSPNRHEPGETR